MFNFIKQNLFLIVIVFFGLFFFQKTIVSGLLPIPSDTIIGLYYPFRDIYAKDNPNGIAFKNFLITDPVRQTYPWRSLSISLEKKLELPTWNPYNFSGTPLLANFQSASLYPLNVIFFMLPFSTAWTVNIVIQPILAGIFMFLFLKNMKLKNEASLLGAVSLSFSGFFIAWMEWGNVLHTALWTPLILLSIDKVFDLINHDSKVKSKKLLLWSAIFALSLTLSFLAGHLQVFFYVALLALFHYIFKLVYYDNKVKALITFVIPSFAFLLLTALQWIPTLKFILLSARSADVAGYKIEGWFIPWQNLVQFIAPDFLGNPATLNYFGTWNYAEFVGYVGLFPLSMALLAMMLRRDRRTFFFSAGLIAALLFALPTILAKIPFVLHIPFFDTSQPTRLIFVIDFCLCVLAALGLDYYLSKKRKIILVLLPIGVVFGALWLFILQKGFGLDPVNLLVSRQNLILPTATFLIVAGSLIIFEYINNKKLQRIKPLLIGLLILITFAELIRFGWKFEPFTRQEYLFPTTPVIEYLQKQEKPFRVMATDSQILPPNFSIMYRIQTTDGYDPLYLQRYGEFAAAVGREKPDISSPFGFNRIITMQNYKTRFVDFLGIRYVLSMTDVDDPEFKKVFSHGKVKIYENGAAFKRAFFVTTTIVAEDKQEAIEALFDITNLPNDRAVLENVADKSIFNKKWSPGSAEVSSYSENKVKIMTSNEGEGFLVVTDAYYPTWRAKIDGHDTPIYLTDYTFRGIIVPKGKHTVEFTNTLL